MNKNIPLYQLDVLSENKEESLSFFFLDQNTEKSKALINIPFRRNFYALGICLSGKAELKANLETYTITPGSLITKPPHTINQWTFMSDDFESLTIFFTKEFITTDTTLSLDKFKFFESTAKHVFKADAIQQQNIVASLNFLKQKYNAPQTYKNEILRNLIHSLLFEVASIYDQQTLSFISKQTRAELIAMEFKKVLNAHFIKERSLKFYAEKLSITPKYLTETIKEVTGKTAGEWISEAVILEAKVSLQSSSLSISQIADLLHFPDSSTFGKFFKTQTGLSPIAYKKG